MEDIEKILSRTSREALRILPPASFTNIIQNSLKEKKDHSMFSSKKWITAIATILIICITSLSAYATFGGKLFGQPVSYWLRIKFSDEYENYTEEENQTITKSDAKVSLVSKVCDDGFVVLEFNVVISRIYGELSAICFDNSANNYHVTIDGTEHWIRPRAKQIVEKVEENEYKVVKELDGKTDFTITIHNMILECENQTIDMPGEFHIRLSKDKALENTKVILPANNKTRYKKMTKEVTKVKITPLQIIAEVTSVIEDVSLYSLTNTTNENYIGISGFRAKNQKGEELVCYSYETQRIINYEDGSKEEWKIGDIGTFYYFENAQMILKEYVIIENKTDIESITIIPTVRQPKDEVEETIELENITVNLK